MRLDELSVPNVERRTAEIDLSAAFGEGVTFTYREPDTAALFILTGDIEQMRVNHPDWPESLIESVLLLAVSHVAPEPGKEAPAKFYAKIAEQNRTLFTHIFAQYNAAFPEVADFGTATEKAKKNS